MHPRRIKPRDGSRLMQRIPPIHAEFHNRDIHNANQGKDGANPRAAFLVFKSARERGMAQPQEEQHQNGSEPRIPDPPGAPHGPAPKAARCQTERGHQSAHRR